MKEQPAKPQVRHKVTIEWETDAHGLAVLPSVLEQMDAHGETQHKIETVRR